MVREALLLRVPLLAALAAGVLASACAGDPHPTTWLVSTSRASAWAFEAPAGAQMLLEAVDRDDVARTPFFRHDAGVLPWHLLVVTHVPTKSSVLIDARRGTELDRFLYVPHRPHPGDGLMAEPLARPSPVDAGPAWDPDRSERRPGGRSPLDQLSVLPDMTVQLTRARATAALDQVTATLRQICHAFSECPSEGTANGSPGRGSGATVLTEVPGGIGHCLTGGLSPEFRDVMLGFYADYPYMHYRGLVMSFEFVRARSHPLSELAHHYEAEYQLAHWWGGEQGWEWRRSWEGGIATESCSAWALDVRPDYCPECPRFHR